MGYSAADESFTHQLPTTFDQVHDPDPTWSDRCYFFAASPDGTMLLASGYGNNPEHRKRAGLRQGQSRRRPALGSVVGPAGDG